MKIDLLTLNRTFDLHSSEYESAALRVLRSGWYILGKELEQFETEFAKFIGRKFCVGLNSGLDALTLSIRALGIGEGDEVIVPSNTFIATVLAITANRATPVFVEPDEFFNVDADKIESAITSKTRAIMIVHLYGQAANMNQIVEIARNHNLEIVEDCAQSHGARFNGQMTGSFGISGCFSFYPTKNLGAFGDSGAIVTDDEDFYRKIKMIRNYGSEKKYHNQIDGVNSRLDEIQAALLRVKLKHLDELTSERKSIAQKYFELIKNPEIDLPKIRIESEHVYHQFVVRSKSRDELQKFLASNEIATMIHYPIPPHLAECYQNLGFKRGDFPIAEKFSEEVLSLPIFNGMLDDEIEFVAKICNEFKR